MTNEEKKAIEHLDKKMKYHQERVLDTFVWLTLDEHYVRVLLNLIEKQQKEIERNKENWLLAQNEILGYAQGYEDGKKHQQTATAMVVENRQYQMIAEEIKRYKAIIEKQQKEIEELKTEKAKRSWVHIKENGEVEPLFYVSEDKIKAKIEELKQKKYILSSRESEIEILQSLLEKE